MWLWWSPPLSLHYTPAESLRQRKRKKCLFILCLHSHADYKKLETLHSCLRGIWSVFSLPVTFHHRLIENGTKGGILLFYEALCTLKFCHSLKFNICTQSSIRNNPTLYYVDSVLCVPPVADLCTIDSTSSAVFNGAHRSLPVLSPFPLLKLDTCAHVSPNGTFL